MAAVGRSSSEEGGQGRETVMVSGLAPQHAAWAVVATALGEFAEGFAGVSAAGVAGGFAELAAGEAFVQRGVVAKVAAFAGAGGVV